MTGRPPPRRRPERRPLGHPGLVPDRGPRGKVHCIDLVERVTDYLDGAVDERERARIDAHLDGCADCARVFAQWRLTIGLVGRVGEEVVDELDPATRDVLLAAFRDQPPPAAT